MQMLQPNMAFKKNKKKNKGIDIASQGHKGPRTSMKSQKDSHKKGCSCAFTLKRFYLHPIVVEVSYTTFQHVNKLGLIVHGNVKSSYKSAFLAHVSKETKSFVLENLRLGLSIFQVMNKHKFQVKEITEDNGDLLRDFFNVNKTFVTLLQPYLEGV